MNNEPENKTPKELPPAARRLIEGLRDTGYNFVTAVADITDNAVAAKATEIGIKLIQLNGGETILMIADNGNGMTETELENAMSYGSSPRSDPSSLGKFGLGLKTASTAFCRKLTVISRKSDIISINQWDLDKIVETDRWTLLIPELDSYEEHIEFLNKISNGGNGTLIVWENVDRLIKPEGEGSRKEQLKKRIQELEEHLSGVFYNFLEKNDKYQNVNISINDKNVEPWDPFCRWLNEGDNKRLNINPYKPFQYLNDAGEPIGTFNITVYILPNKNQLSPEEVERSRYGLDNQGFHIFREGRMIYSGGWPNRLFVKEPHLNLIRVELTFDHKLDDYFQIDIKKSRVDFPSELRKKLKAIITPARREANDRYRRDGQKTDQATLENQHGSSSNAISRHHTEATSESVVTAVNIEKGEAEIKNRYGSVNFTLIIEQSVKRLVQTKESLQDGVLWAPGLADDNKHAVFLNESHEFYKRFYEANKNNTALVVAMDAVMWSLAEAELSTVSDAVKRTLEEMRFSVSRSLRLLAEELPAIAASENDENEKNATV